MPTCECKNCSMAQEHVKICFQIYNKFKYIIDSYVLDFYTDRHWSKLPESWKKAFGNLTPKEISIILDTNVSLDRLKAVCPLSMLALRQVFKIINISRSNFCVQNLFNMPKHTVYKHADNVEREGNSRIDANMLLNHPRLKNNFWKHISPKKKHEIMIIAKICAQIAQHSNCNIVVDFGSGLGHLSRILAYGFGLKVCCLEAQEYLSEQAKKLDQQFEVTATKHLTTEQMNKLVRPVHINMTIKNTIDFDCVAEQVRNAFKLTNDNFKLGVVGLHPCGDLAAILLRFFKLNSNVQFINVASCCYMKLTTDETPITGYPLSRFLNKQEHELCYVARELSCHAIEQYIDRLKAGRYKELKIHAFRAALENIVVKYHPEKKHTGMRNVKCLDDLTFLEYCNKATYDIGIEIPEHEIQSEETLDNLLHWKKVVIFYSLRLMFAPIIESIILLDRFLYVAEPDVECRLIPAFDPKLSPRSHILIAMKHLT